MNAPAPVVAVVEDRRDLYAWIQTRRRHHPGVVGVLTGVTGRQSLAHIADVTLDGLGKDPWLSVSKRPAEHLAGAWLSVGDAGDAIVGYAQTISAWLLPKAVSWFVGLDVRPWVVFTTFGGDPGPGEAARRLADAWGVEVVGENALAEAWPDRPQAEPGPDPVNPSGLPRLPRCDGVRLRSTVRRLLDASDFALVDAALGAEVAAFTARLDHAKPKNKTIQYEEALRRRLASTVDVEEMLLCARAAQIAGLRAGYHVRVDTAILLGAAEVLPRPGLARAQRWWERLDAFRDPDPGAAAALYAAGLDPEALPDITLGDIEHEGGVVTVRSDGRLDTTVAGEGARFVVALLALRRIAGAGPDARLFTTHRADVIELGQVYRLIWGHRADTGVEVAAGPPQRRHPETTTWLARHGIGVEYLRDTA